MKTRSHFNHIQIIFRVILLVARMIQDPISHDPFYHRKVIHLNQPIKQMTVRLSFLRRLCSCVHDSARPDPAIQVPGPWPGLGLPAGPA